MSPNSYSTACGCSWVFRGTTALWVVVPRDASGNNRRNCGLSPAGPAGWLVSWPESAPAQPPGASPKSAAPQAQRAGIPQPRAQPWAGAGRAPAACRAALGCPYRARTLDARFPGLRPGLRNFAPLALGGAKRPAETRKAETGRGKWSKRDTPPFRLVEIADEGRATAWSSRPTRRVRRRVRGVALGRNWEKGGWEAVGRPNLSKNVCFGHLSSPIVLMGHPTGPLGGAAGPGGDSFWAGADSARPGENSFRLGADSSEAGVDAPRPGAVPPGLRDIPRSLGEVPSRRGETPPEPG